MPMELGFALPTSAARAVQRQVSAGMWVALQLLASASCPAFDVALSVHAALGPDVDVFAPRAARRCVRRSVVGHLAADGGGARISGVTR